MEYILNFLLGIHDVLKRIGKYLRDKYLMRVTIFQIRRPDGNL